MSGTKWRSAGQDTSTPDSNAAVVSARSPSAEPTLDQLFAEPIVQQLMRRDRTNESTILRLLERAAAARPALWTKDDPDPDDPNAIVRRLHEAARLLGRRYDRELRARLPGMSRARCNVLIHLAQNTRINQAALAQTLDIRQPTLVRLLDRLEAAGLITRISDPDDRRAHVLALTAKAQPIVECVYDLTRMIYDDLQVEIANTEGNQSCRQIRTLGLA
jgi:MarR family transcriptional regulator for hemolysin